MTPMYKAEARLVGYTQPAEEFKQHFTDALDLIAFCTKVSNPAGQYNLDTAEELVRKLIAWKHWSPLEMANAVVEISTTRDIGRQLLRHRTMSFQEFSQRYADPNALETTFVLREARLQDPKNRQNSFEMDFEDGTARIISETWLEAQEAVIDLAKRTYEWAIDNGIAKEQARAILPEGLTMSKLYANATLRTWIHYLELRLGNGTQKEHMEMARAIAAAIASIFPMTEEFVQK